ncbi:STAS domain-containing protein [Roseovarius sp.]|uniref:STAS domain-containing protein n=1 Tax=Roseovarius sp. TaxID=1486281 RepID=UPI00263926AD|nr:STAS domain-containing protein [Roseovarius sp.]MDM8165065.1 STAS domain-containing protein [Roseovarius sp.]
MNEKLLLPARLDSAAVRALAQAIQARRGHPLTIDAQQVELAGALGLQLLVAAHRQWQEAGIAFRLTGAEHGLLDMCQTLGVPPREIGAAPGEEAAA